MREFKDSGIEWLGEIPKEWGLVRGAFIFSNKKILNSTLQCQERLSLTMEGVIERNIDDNNGLNPLDFRTYQIFQQDDLVFKLIDLDNIKTSRVGYVHKIGIMSSAYIRLIPAKNIFSKYFYYQYFDMYLKHIFNYLGTGVRSTLNCDELLNIKVVYPPLKEQEQIAEFLDKKCEKISNFIDKKQKLITLLEEKKQALINEAVTKGLDKRAELKDSGIKYLGKIPKHWEVRKLKFVISTNIGLVYVPEEIVNNKNEGYPVLRANNIQNGKINYQDLIYVNSKQIREKQVALIGDLLMCVRNGSDNLLGKTAKIMDNDLSFGAFTAIIRSRFNDYLYWIFQTDLLKKSITNFSMAIGIGQISQDDIKNFTVPFPPLQEQKEIAQFLDSKIAKIDTIIEKTKKQIELIKEYKTTLISQAICGRINL
ncbi:restriction endonuclease subunit S [Helicobacter sp. MIT 11-5569]|uniref:restriction endonuclease subunit S n=1 Tax=Helicobacter sp. MIT 11-5569 TaxID=1548151 RepID=UPI0010FF4DCB|nr:restriction endonuclease subunit S [Helicobacter sp. MIT 11-5569]TLD85083.1 restriction endonuclease subunit S [Helicobacter sp. MIT 11-5569]